MGQDLNITLLGAIGFGGMSSAFAGPLILGILWPGVTKTAVYAGFFTGGSFFISVVSGLVTTSGSPGSFVYTVTAWLERDAGNSFSIAAAGVIISVVVTFAVSKVTPGYSQDHLDRFVSR